MGIGQDPVFPNSTGSVSVVGIGHQGLARPESADRIRRVTVACGVD